MRGFCSHSRGKHQPHPAGARQPRRHRATLSRPPGAVSPGQQRPPIPAGLSVSATPPPGNTRRRSRADPLSISHPGHRGKRPPKPGQPAGQDAAGPGLFLARGCCQLLTTRATGPPLRPQYQRETLSRAGQDAGKHRPRHHPATPPGQDSPATTRPPSAGKPQPPAGGCQSGTATATDPGPIPSASATRATGERCPRHPATPPGKMPPGRVLPNYKN